MDWHFQYPSTALTRTKTGDEKIAGQYRGEATKLLYELKNLMRFRNLGQLKMTRFFLDGTVITAWSIFGQDFVNVDVSKRREGGAGSLDQMCSITLIDVPEVVYPMQYPGEIRTQEVLSADYYKTYFTIDLEKCPECESVVSWSLCQSCTPFKYTELTKNPDDRAEPDPELDNKCIHTLENCKAEIIEEGTDEGGSYIIWKAFTESLDFSRTGLGYMLLEGSVKDKAGKTICFINDVVKVDCCEKNPDHRKVEIWWKGWPPGTCTPFIMYGSDAICKMPEEISTLGYYAIAYSLYGGGGGPLYAIPEVNGGCIPFSWSLQGQGILDVPDKDQPGENGKMAYYRLGDDYVYDCTEDQIITLTDRCGTSYEVTNQSCCKVAGEMSILYVTLVMACGQSQQLSVHGGCPPFSWSITGGGGSIVPTGAGQEAVYFSPATNPDCTSNPTIQVRDCCGSSAEIQMAVNCYSGAEDALIDGWQTQDTCAWDAWNSVCNWTGAYWCHRWDCAGTQTYDLHAPINLTLMYGACCDTTVGNEADCNAKCAQTPQERCAGNSICGYFGYFCGTPWSLEDVRTAAMKTAGCCPLNPYTGLPY